MGIKSFFRNLGRSIKRGFNNFVAGAGDVVGKAGTFIQQKAVPAIASGATKAAGLLDKAAPAADAAGVGAEAAEASQVLGKVGNVVGKFGDFIGSNAKPGRVANAAEQAAFAQSPLGMAFKRSQTKPPPEPTGSAPKPNMLAGLGAIKPGLISPAPLGSNPNTYTPKMSSGIEAPPPASQPKLAVIPGGGALSKMVM
jgi:hypothetical protein